MKRSPMPRRRTPLARGALKRSGPVSQGGSKALRTSEGVYRLVRLEVLERDGWRCVLCGRAATDTHHRQPRGMGGSVRNTEIHSPAGLISLDRACHDRIERNRAWAYAEGLLVRRGQNPADIPVRVSGRIWVRYLADGGRIAEGSRRTGQISTTDEDIE